VDPRRRAEVAARLRALGHEFVARDPSDEALDSMVHSLDALLAATRDAPRRSRELTRDSLDLLTAALSADNQLERRQFFADSIVSGVANPMGLGARLWREGDVAVMEVSLGAAFEGAPGRSHGGVVAALLDETMGLVLGMDGVLAYTAQLDITFRAPAPIGESLVARAWREHHRGRKQTIRATVGAGDLLVAEATALFITIDPATLEVASP
jgi:acyl-coenzyme A thioesterase PaaI-like protein